MIKKYIQAAVVLTVGGLAYFFVLGKSNEPAISREYVEQLFSTYEEIANIEDFKNYATIKKLAESDFDIAYTILQIENHQTLYNRLLSKEHYYEASEVAAFKERYEAIEKTTEYAVEHYLAPRLNFEKVLSGEMDDPTIKIELDGTDYTITLKGTMKPSSTIVHWPLYYIDTAHGSYFFKEPHYHSATMLEIQYAFRGKTSYLFNIEQ